MARSGILLVDKPSSVVSRRVVDLLSARLNTNQIGHAGTLDPNASGLFIVLIGSATKLSRFLMEGKKVYHAKLRFGISTDTYDREGRIIAEHDPSHLTLEEIRKVLEEFRGKIHQSPPPFAAVKFRGKPLYRYARKGEIIHLPPRPVMIYSLEILSWSCPDLTMEVVCSRGTYLRSLAHDIGERLGVGGHLYEIRRIESEPYHVQQAQPLDKLLMLPPDELEKEIIPVDRSLFHIPRIEVPSELEGKLKNGQILPLDFLISRIPSHLQRSDLVQLSSPRWLAIARLNHSVSELFQLSGKVIPYRYERVIAKQ